MLGQPYGMQVVYSLEDSVRSEVVSNAKKELIIKMTGTETDTHTQTLTTIRTTAYMEQKQTAPTHMLQKSYHSKATCYKLSMLVNWCICSIASESTPVKKV